MPVVHSTAAKVSPGSAADLLCDLANASLLPGLRQPHLWPPVSSALTSVSPSRLKRRGREGQGEEMGPEREVDLPSHWREGEPRRAGCRDPQARPHPPPPQPRSGCP